MKKTKEKIFEYLSKEINAHFSDELEFAFIFGSWARFENRSDSDIDLMVVFKNQKTHSGKVDGFKEKFIEFQLHSNLIPDKNYPGEYTSILNIRKAIDGYGFIRKENEVEIPTIASNEWTQFNEYRQWLSALAGPNIFLVGDKQKFEDFKKESLITLVLVALLARDSDIFTLDDVINQLLDGDKKYLGFCNTPYTHEYLIANLPIILDSLLDEKFIESLNTDGEFTINRNNALEKLKRLSDGNDVQLQKKFLGSATTQNDKQILRQCLEIGMDFALDDKQKVLNYYPEDQIRNRFIDQIPSVGKGMDEIIKEFQSKILDGSIRQSSPNYLAFPDSGNALSALAADILISFTNQNLIATTKSAPTATFAEMQVIQWLRQLIGFPEAETFPENALKAGGVMTSGGTLANATAFLVARCKAFPQSRKKGLYTSQIQPILIIAADTLYHYSHVASFWWLGLGEENIVFVKALRDFRLDCDDLDKKLSQYNNGKTSKVIAVVGQAGDSRTTTIEDFKKVVAITRKHGVWLHVDACHGGVLLFSKKHRQSMQGIEQADSISIDPHKGLGIPYPSSAVLFRDVKDCELISKSTDITIMSGSSDLGQITPFFGSRAFDSLKLWFLIKHFGTDGIGMLVDYRYKLAQKWANGIKGSIFFESLNEVTLNSVVFSISSKKIQKVYPALLLDREKIGHLNKLIHDTVYQEGYLCIHNFDIVDVSKKITAEGGKLRVLGVTIGNPYTLAADFSNYIAYLDKKVKELIKSL